jgi:hypothetical protein
MFELPIQFPNDVEVIAEEAERFRALSSHDRLAVICGLLDAGALMLHNSPRSAFLVRHASDQERAWRLSIQEFLARHGNRT